MARSFSSAKLLSGLISEAMNVRGFSAAASATQGAANKGAVAAVARTGGTKAKKAEGEAANPHKVSWVPDPRTGCYRPESVSEEIDAAELRNILLKKH